MSKRTWLAAGLLGVMSLGGAAFAQDGGKPAATAQTKEERLKGVIGTYKGEKPGTPSIILTLKDGELTMEAVGTGFPPFPITLTDKDELTAPFLPPGFKFTIQRDKDGKATGIKAETPQGNGELKRQSGKEEPKKEEEKKAEIPDMLGVYEAEDASLGVPKAEAILEKGKLLIRSEGQPDRVITSTKDDILVLDPPIEGVQKIKLTRDKDGKIIGSEATSDQGTLKFVRKTFVKLPGADEAIPDVLGKYQADSPDSPIQGGEMAVEKGQLVLRSDGQPDFPIKIDKDGNLLSDKFPEGVTAKLRKDKDGKVVGIDADTPLGKIGFTRKTFVKPPAAEEAKPDNKKLARIKEAAGTYKTETPDIPVVTMKVKDGKLMIMAEGQPEIEVTLGDDDILKGEMLPDGFKLKLIRDKDGKITGMHAETPMGNADFKFTPEKA
ncbi:MAG: hypothetical protein QM758_02255 [Armatimonas sp.]